MELVNRLLCILLSLCVFCSPVLAQQDASGGDSAPALRTELTEKGVSLKPVVLTPTGGVQTNITDIGRADQYAQVLDNLEMTKRGCWTSRGLGHAAQSIIAPASHSSMTELNEIYETPTVDPYDPTAKTAPLHLFMYLWTNGSGPSASAIISGATVNYNYGQALSNTSEPLASLTLDGDEVGCFRAFSDTQIFFAHPSVQPMIYEWEGNGIHAPNVFTASSEWPVTILGEQYSKPKFLETFASRMAFAGMADHPRTVVLSEYNDPDGFLVSGTPLATDAGAITFPATLGNITGIKRMRLDNTSNTDEVLIVGFDHGFGMISGYDALSFASVPLTEEFGLLSNRTWAQLGNEMFFLATDGLRKFSTGSGLATLSNASVSFNVREIFQQINKGNPNAVSVDDRPGAARKAFVVPRPSTQELLFWFPTGTSRHCDHALVLNYNTGVVTNSINNPVFSTRSGVEYSCGLTINQPVFQFPAGFSNVETTVYGQYQRFVSGKLPLVLGFSADTYGGTAYSWSYVSPLIGGTSPVQNASVRRIDVLTDGPDQSFTCEAYTLTQRVNATTGWYLQDTHDFSITADSITAIQTWTSGTTTTYPKFTEFQPRGSGRYWTIRIKGTGGQHINLAGLQAVLTLGGWGQ